MPKTPIPFPLIPALLLLTIALHPARLLSLQSQLPAAPPSTAATLETAMRSLHTGHAQDALQQLDAIETSSPATPQLDRLRGMALYELNRPREAEGAFAQAIARDPADTESVQMRALSLFRLGRPADAIPLLESAHSTEAQSKIDPSYLLALCYIDTRQFDKARNAFADQYGLAPDSAAAYLLAGRMFFRREFVAEAKLSVERAAQLDQRLPLVHGLMGEIALAQNRTEDAVHAFEQERELNPLEGGTYERLGDAWMRGGHYAQAQQVLQQAVLLEPNSTGPYMLLGRAHLKLDDPAGALQFLQKAEQMDPANFMTHNLLAQTYRALGRQEDASRETALTEAKQAADTPAQAAPR